MRRLFLLACIFGVIIIMASGCSNNSSPPSTTYLFSSPFLQAKFENRDIAATFPSSITYFPVQLPQFGSEPYPASLARGELILDNGSFKLKSMHYSGLSEINLLVWPPGYSSLTVSGATYVVNKDSEIVAFIGDKLRVGGGQIPAEIVEKYTGQSMPEDCQPPYWLVSSIVKNESSLSGNLPNAKPYTILCEGNLANEKEDRTVGLWFITSKNASSFEEWTQTAILAVSDLHRVCGRDFTEVLLVESNEVRIDYAQASYAADGKGALGMTGSNLAKEMYWKVRAANRQLTEREKAIAKIWSEKQFDFPRTNPVSSLSYDAEALRKYIADTLGISIDDVQSVDLKQTEYQYDERL
jgi:hypothetical protein